jgi:hypothetical protein
MLVPGPTHRWLPATLLLLCLAGCNPIYRTHYDYQPPDSPVGRSCIATCGGNRELCISNNQLRHSACRSEREAEYQRCMASAVREKKDPSKACSRGYCPQPDDHAACEPRYAQCYRDCGGRVVEERRCVANC